MSNEDSPLADRVFVLFLASVFLLSVTVAAVIWSPLAKVSR